MKIRKMQYLFVILSLILMPIAVKAFDCSKAATRIEFLICSTPDVFKLEEDMLVFYKQIVANKIPLVPTQKEWLRQRNSCKDINCLRAVYYSRIVLFKTLLTSKASPPIKYDPSVMPVPDGFTKSADVFSAISKASPTSSRRIETHAPTSPRAHETVSERGGWEEFTPKPEILSATQSKKPSLKPGGEWRGFLMGIVFLASTFGFYKTFRLPQAQSFLKSTVAKFREKSKQFITTARRISFAFRFRFVMVPLLIITCWLLFNVAVFISAVADKGFVLSDCSFQSEAAHVTSLYEPSVLQNSKTKYYALHPECALEKGENKGFNIFGQRGFLIAYDVWAFLAVLYLDIALLLQNAPLTRHNIIPFCLAGSMVCSRIILSFFWPFKSFLSPLEPPNILMGLLLAGPVPPIVMALLAPLSIAGALILFLSLLSIVTLPVVLLINQVNILIVERQRQEVQTTGLHVWLMHLKNWLLSATVANLSYDGDKDVYSATPEKNAEMSVPSDPDK